MAINNTLIKTTLLLDGKQPEQILAGLASRANVLEKEIGEALSAGDPKKLKLLYKEYNNINKEAERIKQATFDYKKILDNLSGASLKDLRKAKKELNIELDKMTRGTKEYIAKSKELKSVNAEINNVKHSTDAAAASSGGWMSKMSAGFNKYFGIITAAAAAFTGVIFSIRKAVDAFNEFEESVDNLGAITGLAGDELAWLSEEAKKMSVSTVEGSIKIKQSANDIITAYKDMGSARPELLKNKEDLASVTKEALILAEASKMQTAPAIEAVAAAMNQFNLDANQGRRIINAFAAGSLEGSAEVDDLTQSLANVGTVADDSNMTLEQTIAILEVLGEKQLKGAEAGTMLRSSLMKMKAAGVGYQSGLFNVRDGLIEVNKKLETFSTQLEKDTYKQEVFGERSIVVGTILLKNIEKYDDLTKAVTGTNTAIEQATKNTNNNAASLAQAKNRAALMAIEFGEKLAPAMTFSTNMFTKFLRVLVASIDFYKEHRRLINSIAVGITTYFVAVQASIVWDKLKIFWTDKVQGSLRNLFTTIKTNPWGLIASAVATAITFLIQYTSSVKTATDEQKAFNETLQKSNDILVNQKPIEDRMNVLNTLNKRQLEILKQDIETQLAINEDFQSKLLSQAKERLDNDSELNRLKEARAKASGTQLLNIDASIYSRKKELIRDLDEFNKKHDTSIKSLKADLLDVTDILKKFPDEIVIPPDSDDQIKARD
jgi:TP901 family phage tail tape measure protein